MTKNYHRLDSAYKGLSEIRALGYLCQCALKVIPRSDTRSGPDLAVEAPTGDMVDVEVSALRMAAKSAEELQAVRENPDRSGYWEAAIYTDGSPEPGSPSVRTVVQRFSGKARSKNHQHPPDKPSLLWLDLQFEDRRATSCDEAWPLSVLDRGRFHTGGVWLAFFGGMGTPLLDAESVDEGLPPDARGLKYTCLHTTGYFQSGEARASAVVISWPDCTVIFENPRAANPLPRAILERLLHLRWFDWPRSWVRPFWKEPQATLADLQDQVRLALNQIAGVARVAKLGW